MTTQIKSSVDLPIFLVSVEGWPPLVEAIKYDGKNGALIGLFNDRFDLQDGYLTESYIVKGTLPSFIEKTDDWTTTTIEPGDYILTYPCYGRIKENKSSVIKPVELNSCRWIRNVSVDKAIEQEEETKKLIGDIVVENNKETKTPMEYASFTKTSLNAFIELVESCKDTSITKLESAPFKATVKFGEEDIVFTACDYAIKYGNGDLIKADYTTKSKLAASKQLELVEYSYVGIPKKEDVVVVNRSVAYMDPFVDNFTPFLEVIDAGSIEKTNKKCKFKIANGIPIEFNIGDRLVVGTDFVGISIAPVATKEEFCMDTTSKEVISAEDDSTMTDTLAAKVTSLVEKAKGTTKAIASTTVDKTMSRAQQEKFGKLVTKGDKKESKTVTKAMSMTAHLPFPLPLFVQAHPNTLEEVVTLVGLDNLVNIDMDKNVLIISTETDDHHVVCEGDLICRKARTTDKSGLFVLPFNAANKTKAESFGTDILDYCSTKIEYDHLYLEGVDTGDQITYDVMKYENTIEGLCKFLRIVPPERFILSRQSKKEICINLIACSDNSIYDTARILTVIPGDTIIVGPDPDDLKNTDKVLIGLYSKKDPTREFYTKEEYEILEETRRWPTT